MHSRKIIIRKRLALIMAALVMLGGGAAISTPSASASGSPVSHVNSWAPNYRAPGANISHWSKPGTKFRMVCWFDHAGRRWFFGQIYDNGGYYYMPSNYVSAQRTVGRC